MKCGKPLRSRRLGSMPTFCGSFSQLSCTCCARCRCPQRTTTTTRRATRCWKFSTGRDTFQLLHASPDCTHLRCKLYIDPGPCRCQRRLLIRCFCLYTRPGEFSCLIPMVAMCRLPLNEAMRPFSSELMATALQVLAEDNEENGLLCLRISFELHKQYRPALEEFVPKFLDLVRKV